MKHNRLLIMMVTGIYCLATFLHPTYAVLKDEAKALIEEREESAGDVPEDVVSWENLSDVPLETEVDMTNTEEEDGAADEDNPALWYQGRIPDANGRLLKAGTSYESVASGGCSYYAAAYMLYKMGLLRTDFGETPLTVLDKAEKIGAWLSFGKMDFERINEIYPDVECTAYKAKLPSKDFEEQLDFLQKKMDEGEFIILCIAGGKTSGHYIFLDSITEDGDMVIGDSAYDGLKWTDTHGPAGAYIVDYSSFTCQGVTPDGQPSIYTES